MSGHSIGQWPRHRVIQPTVYRGPGLYPYFDVGEATVVRWLVDNKGPPRDSPGPETAGATWQAAARQS